MAAEPRGYLLLSDGGNVIGFLSPAAAKGRPDLRLEAVYTKAQVLMEAADNFMIGADEEITPEEARQELRRMAVNLERVR
jgi:hypothetical protein